MIQLRYLKINIKKREFQALFAHQLVSQKRILECTDFVAGVMDLAVGRIYVQNFFDESSRKAVINPLK